MALWSDRQNSERALKTQAQSSLEQLVRVTSDNVRSYLQSASQIVKVNRANMSSGLISADDPSGQLLNFQALLDSVPQLNGVLVGHADGRFVFARRGGPHNTDRFTRVIEVRPQRRVLTSTYNQTGTLTSQSSAANDYDPRTRPWYVLAQQKPGEVVWTDPYIFASSGQPGVTVASSLTGSSGALVIGADVQLRQLADFLTGMQISANGRAFITDGGGHAIATSRAWPGEPSTDVPLLSEIADPALRALLDEHGLPTTRDGTHWYTVNGQQFAAILRPVEVQPGVTWMVGVYAPTADFTAGLNGSRSPLLFVLLVSLSGSLLAWPIVLRATRPLAELQRQATTDYLTGLPNRASFMAQLHETLRDPPGRAALGVAIFDLDGFKQVNDTFGHHTGDEVLHAVGARMLAALRVGDTLGRLGGDEFALLIQANSREEVRLRVEGVLDAIARRPIIVDGISHALASTAGLAFHDAGTRTTYPTEPRPENSAQLIARADTALIRGKRREKGRVWVEGEVTMPTLFR
ncbi:sensor domain-containing diguanylate cyclase [Deinococcus sp.]|uniref:sensor domain-containing diguanylate cyclase n=1 Tax=Deinococcus sp. TaxID=47478 RepID=UPI0025C5DD3B|nr:sensor domain-containing diguanylate cyclase [Deinococcus sp.]